MLTILRSWIARYFSDEEAVLLLVLLGVGLLIVLTMGDILAPMIASIIIAFLMQGMVVRLRQWGLPHSLAVLLTFCTLIAGLAAIMLGLVPIFWRQATRFFAELPRMLREWQELMLVLPERYPNLISKEQVEQMMSVTSAELGYMGQNILSFSVSNLPILVTVLIYFVLVPILVFFFLKDSRILIGWFAGFLPRHRPLMSKIWQEMNQQFANYVRGKVIEIFIVGTCSFVIFMLLGVNYAALLAIAVGLSVLIPYIGAAVVTIPVAMVGFFQWGWSDEFIYLILAYGVIQAVDGNILVPLLFSEAVNLHPVAIILAILVFGGFWGFWGVFFAIPLATFVKAIVYAWPIGVQRSQEAEARQSEEAQTDNGSS